MGDLRNLEELAEFAQQQVDRVTRMQADLAGQSAEARSPRDYVWVRTGTGGAVQELVIEPAALRLSAPEVAAEVTAAIGAAQQEYARRVDEILAPVLDAYPSEESLSQVDAGVSRLETIADDLERLARRRDLAD